VRHEWRIGEVCTGFAWRDLLERDHLENLDIGGRIILKWIFRKLEGKPWTGFL